MEFIHNAVNSLSLDNKRVLSCDKSHLSRCQVNLTGFIIGVIHLWIPYSVLHKNLCNHCRDVDSSWNCPKKTEEIKFTASSGSKVWFVRSNDFSIQMFEGNRYIAMVSSILQRKVEGDPSTSFCKWWKPWQCTIEILTNPKYLHSQTYPVIEVCFFS